MRAEVQPRGRVRQVGQYRIPRRVIAEAAHVLPAAVDEGKTTTTTFSDIKMGKPDPALFAVPASYKKYGSMQEMMMGNMQRLMQQQFR